MKKLIITFWAKSEDGVLSEKSFDKFSFNGKVCEPERKKKEEEGRNKLKTFTNTCRMIMLKQFGQIRLELCLGGGVCSLSAFLYIQCFQIVVCKSCFLNVVQM